MIRITHRTKASFNVKSQLSEALHQPIFRYTCAPVDLAYFLNKSVRQNQVLYTAIKKFSVRC